MTSFALTSALFQQLICQLLNKTTCQGKLAEFSKLVVHIHEQVNMLRTLLIGNFLVRKQGLNSLDHIRTRSKIVLLQSQILEVSSNLISQEINAFLRLFNGMSMERTFVGTLYKHRSLIRFMLFKLQSEKPGTRVLKYKQNIVLKKYM